MSCSITQTFRFSWGTRWGLLPKAHRLGERTTFQKRKTWGKTKGGIDVDGSLQGTHMEQLKPDSLVLQRWPNDRTCPEYRVRIWKRAISVYVPLVLTNE